MPDLEVAESLDTAASVEPEVQDDVLNEQPEVEQQEAPEIEEDSDNQEDKPELEAQADDKGVPAKYKDLFAKDKDLRFAYMGYKALRKEFPGGVKEARGYRDIANEIGGREGIEAMQADRQAISDFDTKLANGDPTFIKGIAEEFPEGFSKLAPHILETLYERDPATYSHLMGRVIFNSLGNSPIGDVYEALKADKPEVAQKLAQWYNGIKDLASKVPEKKIDPEREKLNKEKTEFQEQKATEFRNSVVNEIKNFNAKDLDSELAKIFKVNGKDYADFKKKNADVATEMLNKAYHNMVAEVSKDQAFVKQHNDLLEKQQREKLVSAMRSKSQKAIPDAVKKAYRLFNFTTAKKTVATNNNQVPAGTIRIAKQPTADQIDWNRTSENEMESMLLNNTAFIKGQKQKVVWN